MQKLIKSMSKNNKKRSIRVCGFTLVEVMIALLLLTVGIMGVSKLQTVGMRSVALSHQRLYNSKVASSYLEQLMALDYGHEWLTDGRHGPLDIEQGNGKVLWEVREGQPVAGLKLIQVTIEYSAPNVGKSHQSLEYIKSPR